MRNSLFRIARITQFVGVFSVPTIRIKIRIPLILFGTNRSYKNQVFLFAVYCDGFCRNKCVDLIPSGVHIGILIKHLKSALTQIRYYSCFRISHHRNSSTKGCQFMIIFCVGIIFTEPFTFEININLFLLVFSKLNTLVVEVLINTKFKKRLRYVRSTGIKMYCCVCQAFIIGTKRNVIPLGLRSVVINVSQVGATVKSIIVNKRHTGWNRHNRQTTTIAKRIIIYSRNTIWNHHAPQTAATPKYIPVNNLYTVRNRHT